MYDIWFYLFFWSIGFLFALPIIFMGFVWLILQKSPSAPRPLTLQDIDILLSQVKSKEGLQTVLEKFLHHFKVLPSNQTDLKHWLGIVGKMASSEYFEIDYVTKLGRDLEDANEEIEQEIADTIGLALKNRKKR